MFLLENLLFNYLFSQPKQITYLATERAVQNYIHYNVYGNHKMMFYADDMFISLTLIIVHYLPKDDTKNEAFFKF